MTELYLWLPYGTVGIVVLILLAVLRVPDEVESRDSPDGPSIGIGTVRVAAVTRIEDSVVVDGLVDRLSVLGSVGSPFTMLLATGGTDEASYRRLQVWAESDAVVEIALPSGDHHSRVVGLRSGGSELRLPILALSS